MARFFSLAALVVGGIIVADIITHGTARLFKLLPDGRRQITGFAGPGTFLGLAAHDTYSFGAEALEPVRLCRFSRSGLTDLMEDFPALEQRLLRAAAHTAPAAATAS